MIAKKDPHGGHSTYRPKSLVRQSALIPTTNQFLALIIIFFKLTLDINIHQNLFTFYLNIGCQVMKKYQIQGHNV